MDVAIEALVALQRAKARIEQLEAELAAMADKRDAWKRAAEKAEQALTTEARLFPDLGGSSPTGGE